jgi:Protein of unknown function (DUF1761)
MYMLPINLFAISVAALTAFVLGFLFHGPLFGKLWMRLADVHPTGNERFADMIPQLLWNLLANFVTAFVLAGALWIAFSSSVVGDALWYKGAICGAWLWLGFLVPSSSIEVIWFKRKTSLWLFESACSLVVMVIMGAILASW